MSIRKTHPHARPTPDWRVNADGDLEMAGQSIVAPAQFSPDGASYAEACANIELAAAAPAMAAALSRMLDWCACGNIPDELYNAGLKAIRAAGRA